jgi:tRNA nucleotidyltransferase/poly(A) polymerase
MIPFLPTELTTVLDHLKPLLPSEKPVYLVGGGVRDLLLGRTLKDIDLVFQGDVVPVARKLRTPGEQVYSSWMLNAVPSG